MPAVWSPKDERQYGHILASCQKRGRYGKSRCKRIAGATVNKTRRDEGRTLGFWTPAFSGLTGLEKRLKGYQRRDFCLPGRTPSAGRYPVPDCSHADNALARASAAYHEGYLTSAQYKKVRACARRAQRKFCR